MTIYTFPWPWTGWQSPAHSTEAIIRQRFKMSPEQRSRKRSYYRFCKFADMSVIAQNISASATETIYNLVCAGKTTTTATTTNAHKFQQPSRSRKILYKMTSMYSKQSYKSACTQTRTEKYNLQFHVSNAAVTLKPCWSGRDYYEQVELIRDSHHAKFEDNSFYTVSETVIVKVLPQLAPWLFKFMPQRDMNVQIQLISFFILFLNYVPNHITFLSLERSFCKNSNLEV